MVFTDEAKAAGKFLQVNKHYGTKRLWKEFPTKNWTLRGLNKLFKNTDETGAIEHLKGAGRLWSVRCNDITELDEQLTHS